MIRDLVEVSVRLVKEEKIAEVESKAKEIAITKMVNAILPIKKKSFPDKSEEEVRQIITDQLKNGELDNVPVEVEIEEAPKQLTLGRGRDLPVRDTPRSRFGSPRPCLR